MSITKFCNLPFSRAHINTQGNVFLCCSAWTGTPVGNVFQNDFGEIWNSKTAREIRESIFDQSFKFCRKEICPHIVSGKASRPGIVEKFGSIISGRESILTVGPKHLSLNYDPTCNLYCKSCRNSRTRLDEANTERLIKFQDSLLGSSFFREVGRVTVSGSGEALASRVYLDLFSKIRSDTSPLLKITLRTNGMLLTPQTWERLRNVHYAIDLISISIDAAREATYHALRRGGDFRNLMKNLEFAKHLKETNGIKIKLNFVVQKANYSEMPEFVALAKKFGCDMVAFSRLLPSESYSRGEYDESAIHDPGSSDFSHLKALINQPIFRDPIVRLRNLSNLLADGGKMG